MKTEILKIDEEAKDLAIRLSSAAKIIREGGTVIFPTETVYGIGVDAIAAAWLEDRFSNRANHVVFFVDEVVGVVSATLASDADRSVGANRDVYVIEAVLF